MTEPAFNTGARLLNRDRIRELGLPEDAHALVIAARRVLDSAILLSEAAAGTCASIDGLDGLVRDLLELRVPGLDRLLRALAAEFAAAYLTLHERRAPGTELVAGIGAPSAIEAVLRLAATVAHAWAPWTGRGVREKPEPALPDDVVAAADAARAAELAQILTSAREVTRMVTIAPDDVRTIVEAVVAGVGAPYVDPDEQYATGARADVRARLAGLPDLAGLDGERLATLLSIEALEVMKARTPAADDLAPSRWFVKNTMVSADALRAERRLGERCRIVVEKRGCYLYGKASVRALWPHLWQHPRTRGSPDAPDRPTRVAKCG